MINNYFKRTTKKLVGTLDLLKEISKGTKYTHYMLKYDGIHAELIISEDTTKFITRDGKDVSHKIPYLVKAIDNWKHREAYIGVYACELVHLNEVKTNPRNSWSKAMSVIGSKDYRPELDEINCIIYDVHERLYANVDKRNYFNRWLKYPISLPELFFKAPYKDVSEIHLDWEYAIMEMKCEGFVLFDINANVDWDKTHTKIKPKIEGDVIVTKINEGTKGTKNEGKCGSLSIAVYREGKLHNLGNVSGMEQTERDYWTVCAEQGYNLNDIEYMKVIQVEASEVTQAGKLRFSNYIRLREDKEVRDCDYTQFI